MTSERRHDTQDNDNWPNDIRHKNENATLSIKDTQNHVSFLRLVSAMLAVILLTIVMLNEVMLAVVMLSVSILSFMAPLGEGLA